MRVAFYAPLKAPNHPVPSGDRQMARSIVRALGVAGHEVELVSTFRSLDLAGDARRQARLSALGERLARRLLHRYALSEPRARPQVWLTYHLYHKAPDWIGPMAARALSIPYVAIEVSYAPKQANGRWRLGHEAVRAAIVGASAVVALNPDDVPCVAPLVACRGRLELIPPFLDTAPFAAAMAERDAHRARLAASALLDDTTPRLFTVAMMRPGEKLRSYEVLGRALLDLRDRRWVLVVAGDGPARAEALAALAPLGSERLRHLGTIEHDRLPVLYAACDLFVWPAVGESYGMALLEAQAAGLPVVAGRAGGVPKVVYDGETGILVAPEDALAFAAAVR
ncbi:MAG: glycosyltransferase family 4 protein, partial [Alphaproteobacteria bacterium]